LRPHESRGVQARDARGRASAADLSREREGRHQAGHRVGGRAHRQDPGALHAVAGGLSPAPALATGVSPRSARRGSPAVWLLLGPPSLVLTLLFMLPIGLVLVTSVTDPRLSLAHYGRIFTVPVYTQVMLNTFVTSLIVTALC